jgi:SAM-dependent methyltransferase
MSSVYDRFLVPAIFRPYAEELAGRVARCGPSTVLELAAGTGALTAEVTARLPAARVIATDLNEAMIGVGSARVGAATWQQADAMRLPFDHASFDLVVCQFGVMFFPDRPQAYAGVARVLRPAGQFLFNCWGPLAGHEVETTVLAALADRFPHDPPTFLARVPHGYHDVERIRADLGQAGFVDVAVETVDLECRAESAAGLARGYCRGTPLLAEIVARGDLAAAEAGVAAVLAERFGPGPVSGRMTALVVSAVAPG